MKIIQFTLLILILLTACESKKNDSSEKKVVESEIKNSSSLGAQKLELTQSEQEGKFRTEIEDRYLTELSKCRPNINAVTDFNGKTEFWRICKNENGIRIIQINSHEKTALYEEVYFEQNGELIYAEESIKYMPINHFILQPWTCYFYTKKGELVSLMSHGHGKTEDDEWNPEIIFDMHKNRISELNKIEKE